MLLTLNLPYFLLLSITEKEGDQLLNGNVPQFRIMCSWFIWLLSHSYDWTSTLSHAGTFTDARIVAIGLASELGQLPPVATGGKCLLPVPAFSFTSTAVLG